MKNLIRATLILALLITNKNFSQEVEVDSILPVMLDEVIVSTPFGETADENVIKVTKVDLAKMSAVNTTSAGHRVTFIAMAFDIRHSS